MIITYYMKDWYTARLSFITKYGTRAIATGNGTNREKAIAECLKDYIIIKNL